MLTKLNPFTTPSSDGSQIVSLLQEFLYYQLKQPSSLLTSSSSNNPVYGPSRSPAGPLTPTLPPASSHLHPRIPSHYPFQSPQSHCAACKGCGGNYVPLNWTQSPRKPAIRTHFPLDLLLHSIADIPFGNLFPPLCILPHRISPTLPSLHPTTDLPTPSYASLKQLIRLESLPSWRSNPNVPEPYLFQPTLKPHPFTGLDRFLAGLIY